MQHLHYLIRFITNTENWGKVAEKVGIVRDPILNYFCPSQVFCLLRLSSRVETCMMYVDVVFIIFYIFVRLNFLR